jgi:hypothetical protein
MASNFGYYLPVAPDFFSSVRFLDISPKLTKGRSVLNDEFHQAGTPDGVPKWTLSALVKIAAADKPETQDFTLIAPEAVAQQINKLPELTAIELLGLAAGKWSREASDRTEWTFQNNGG